MMTEQKPNAEFLQAYLEAMPNLLAAMRASLSAVNIASGYAGADALHADQPMQRCFRDLHAAAQHIYFSTAASKRYAKLRFGMEQQTFWF